MDRYQRIPAVWERAVDYHVLTSFPGVDFRMRDWRPMRRSRGGDPEQVQAWGELVDGSDRAMVLVTLTDRTSYVEVGGMGDQSPPWTRKKTEK